MRSSNGQFIKGHSEGIRFKKGQIPWNKGLKGFGFGSHSENRFKPRKFSDDEKKYVTINCQFCKKEVRDFPSNKRVYCSRSCRAKYLTTFKSGENAYNWQGGIPRKQLNKNWVERNRDRKYFINLRREARLYGALGSHTLEEWQALKIFYHNMCLCCKQFEPIIKLTEDHIIPLSMGGSDNISNIQPLCKSCNSIKHTKTIDYREIIIQSQKGILN